MANGDEENKSEEELEFERASSEKAKEMLQGSRTNIFDSVEEAINAAVMGVKK